MGLVTAQRLAAGGANVVVADVDLKAAQSAVNGIAADGGFAQGAKADCRSYQEVKLAVQTALSFDGRLDILVNCAGGAAARVFGRTETFENLDIDIIDWGIDVNLRGAIYYCHAALPHMIAQESGVIVNMGSVDGTTGTTAIEYGAAKSGIVGLTKSLAIYGAPYGIRVCCVSPGPVLTRPAMAKMPTLLGRAAEPSEIVDLVEYLCSDKAAFITGTDYLIDGGKSCGGVSRPVHDPRDT